MTTYKIDYGQGNYQTRQANSAMELANTITLEGLPCNYSDIRILDLEDNALLIARWYGISPEGHEVEEILQEVCGGFYVPWSDFV